MKIIKIWCGRGVTHDVLKKKNLQKNVAVYFKKADLKIKTEENQR